MRATDEGALLKTRVKGFHASHSGRRDLGEENGYVFCSRTKPAIMAEQNGRVAAFYLAPFATEDSRETVRRNANFHALYFAICHGGKAGRAAVRDLSGVAREHNYRVALNRAKLVSLSRAEEVITPSERSPVAAARESERQPIEATRSQPSEAPSPRQLPARGAEEDKGLLTGPRRLTNQAFDALDEVGNWMLGRSR